MEQTSKAWRREALRIVPIVIFTVLGYLLQPTLEGEYGLVAVNSVALVAGLVAMRWRRRHPATITVALSLLMVPFPGLWLVTGWAYLSLATHLRTTATVMVGALVAVCFAVESARSNADDLSWAALAQLPLTDLAAAMVMSVLSTVALGALGSYLGSRRREAVAMQERLALAERERQLAREKAKAEERNRIAREMHDILAHKITLISLHAGVLAYRDDLSDDEVKQAGETIMQSSHEALAELRMILGQLRQTDENGPAKPQPTLASLDQLVETHRTAGHRVIVDDRLEGAPPQTVSRHAYRIIQEGLTNAARHAPGTPARVLIAGNAADGISVRVTNPLSVAPGTSPGAGVGLIGLQERVELSGGRITTGEDDGHFVVDAWLAWQPT